MTSVTRPLRLCFKDAVYHIISRGNRKENIFHSDEDRQVFLEKMNETFEKYSFDCYAYCLMNNHYHLFIKTTLANLPEGIHYLNSSYANWFRVKHEIIGSIFQGRYKSILVDRDNYALKLSAYIHLNPLRAAIVNHIGEYNWSSYLDYIGRRKPFIKRLDISFILSQFGGDMHEAQKKYNDFVLNNIDMENPQDKSYKGFIVGSDGFIEEIKTKLKNIANDREVIETRLAEPCTPEDIFEIISTYFKISKQDILAKRKDNIYRQIALFLLKTKTSLSLKEIGILFNMDYTAVSMAGKRFREKWLKDKELQEEVNNLISLINETKGER